MPKLSPLTVSDELRGIRDPGKPRDPNSIAGRLRAGQTLLFSDERGFSGYYTQLKRQGYKMRSHRIDRGVVVWAEPIE